MNKIFKVIFSKAKGIFVVTGENAKAQGKSKHLKAIAASVMIASTLGIGGNVMANPTEISFIKDDITNLKNALSNNDVQIIENTQDSISLKEGTYRINGYDHNLTLENNSTEWRAALNLSRPGAKIINQQNSLEFNAFRDINFTSTGDTAFGIWVWT